MDTDKSRRKRPIQPRRDWALLGKSLFRLKNCLRICLHLCSSVVKVFFNGMVPARIEFQLLTEV
jgi:hypothetical protein